MTAWKCKETVGACTLYLGDCKQIIPLLSKFDAVITDLPYGITQCNWDKIIPFEKLWNLVSIVCSKNTPILFFGVEPFSTLLKASNLKQFKYDWVWCKTKATGFLNSKRQPLQAHEMISVFCEGTPFYSPQMSQGHARKIAVKKKQLKSVIYGKENQTCHYDSTARYPTTLLNFSSDTQKSSFHPVQKPLALMEYLVQTYTSEKQSVIDFTMGSGTTGVACVKQGRKFTGIEQNEEFFEIACERIRKAYEQPDLLIEAAKQLEPKQQTLFGEAAC